MRRLLRALGCAALGALCAMAFVISPEGYVGVSDAPAAATDPLWTALALLLALGFGESRKRGLRVPWSAWLFGALFGVANYFGSTLFAYDSWAFLNGPLAWGGALLCCAGQGLCMAVALAWVMRWLSAPQGAALTVRGALWQKWLSRYRRHPALWCALALVVCWLPYLVAFYPGTVIWDMGEMAAQFFGQRPVDTWHPVFTTWVLGSCVWLGRQAGSDNLGTFLFTLLQTGVLAWALGRAVAVLRRLGLSGKWQLGAMAFFGLTPLFAGYAQTVGKDTLYTALLLLFTLQTIGALRGWLTRPRDWAGYGAAALLCCLVRSNGLYVVLPTALLLIAFGAKGRARLHAACALGCAVLCAVLFSSALLPALGVRDETASGLYSVCFQQSARVLRDHADEVTDEEYAAIDKVLDAEKLPELYEPVISDPVKYTFRQYGQGAAAEKAALAEYRQTWLAMLKKYPVSYLEAFVAGNSGYYAFTPKIDSARTYNAQGGTRFVFETYELGEDPRLLHTTQIGALSGARTLLAAYARGWRHIPLLALTLLCPAYTWLLVGAGLAAARKRRWRALIAFAPALLSLGVCLLAPVNDYFRYFLPIAAMAPLLLGVAKSAQDNVR